MKQEHENDILVKFYNLPKQTKTQLKQMAKNQQIDLDTFMKALSQKLRSADQQSAVKTNVTDKNQTLSQTQGQDIQQTKKRASGRQQTTQGVVTDSIQQASGRQQNATSKTTSRKNLTDNTQIISQNQQIGNSPSVAKRIKHFQDLAKKTQQKTQNKTIINTGSDQNKVNQQKQTVNQNKQQIGNSPSVNERIKHFQDLVKKTQQKTQNKTIINTGSVRGRANKWQELMKKNHQTKSMSSSRIQQLKKQSGNSDYQYKTVKQRKTDLQEKMGSKPKKTQQKQIQKQKLLSAFGNYADQMNKQKQKQIQKQKQQRQENNITNQQNQKIRQIIAQQQKQQQNLVKKFSGLDIENTVQGVKILQRLNSNDLTQQQRNQINEKIKTMRNPNIDQDEILYGTFFNDKYLGNMYKNFREFKQKHKQGESDTNISYSTVHKVTDAAKGVYNSVANYFSGNKGNQ